jgi:hypothetical protein
MGEYLLGKKRFSIKRFLEKMATFFEKATDMARASDG